MLGAQIDQTCKVLVYFNDLVLAVQDKVAALDPETEFKETAWWYKELVSNQNIHAITVEKQQNASGDIFRLWAYMGWVIVPPRMPGPIIWHVHWTLYHCGAISVLQKLVELNFFWPFMRADIMDIMKSCNYG